MTERVTLRAGDYVAIKDIESPEQATAIADAFIEAGAKSGAGYPYADDGDGWDNLFWDGGDNKTNRGSGGIRRLMPFHVLGETVSLRPGDHVSTEGMTEDQYHAVARAFMAAGAASGEYPNYSFANEEISCPRWSFGNRRGALFHGLSGCFGGRHLTPAQVIGAVNAGNQQEETMDDDFKLKCILHSAQKYLEEEREELEMAKFHNVKAGQKRDRHDELMKRARDMLPDGWRLVRDKEPEEDLTDPANWKQGDQLECVKSWACGTKGKIYKVGNFNRVGYRPRDEGVLSIPVSDDDGDNASVAHHYFRFHHRPT